jgi:predicted Zn-dependent protease
LSWLVTVSPAIVSTPPVAVLVSECRVAVGDWALLYSSLTNQNWAELDFLRHAFSMRALREQRLSAAAKAEWDQVLKAANGQRQSLIMLVRTLAQWKWNSEAEEVLWAIVNRFPDETWAFQSLSKELLVNGRTRPLMTLLSQESKRFPADLSIKNNLASIALLLDASELKPYDLAREVYDRVPTNAAYASTYAYSLLLQQKPSDAFKVMQQLKPQQLDDPAIAGYYGLILKATGDTNKANTYLSWASRAKLLPEEQKLFERAKAGIAGI